MIDNIYAMASTGLISIVPALLVAIARAVQGWYEKYASDGVTDWEWGQLLSTVVRTFVYTLFIMLSGLVPDPLTASATAGIADYGIHTVKKVGKK